MTEHGAGAVLPNLGPTVVTVGTFDGVHRGHLDVLARLAARGRETGRASLLLTFEPHPLELLHPERAPLLLTTRREKLAAIAATGVDCVAILPFNRALSLHSAEQFVDLVLRDRFDMAELLIGHDHGFGRGRAGDVDTLRRLGAARGFGVEVVAPVEAESGEPVSSSRIRRALGSGDLQGAASGLGRLYSVAGMIVQGDGRGRSIGFPTINLQLESVRKLLPPDGVYAVRVATPNGAFGGMLNLGGRPTFGDERRTIEAHLFDASGDFYGQHVEVAFVARSRDTRRFDDAAALMAQLLVDEQNARRALTLVGESGNFKGSMHFPPPTP